MEKILAQATDWIFWSALVLSLVNMIAGVFGMTMAVEWLLGIDLPAIFMTFALVLWGALMFSWLNSGMSNAAGMALYAANVLAAPFFYEFLGMPYVIGLLVAALPFPLYFWTQRVIDLAHSLIRR